MNSKITGLPPAQVPPVASGKAHKAPAAGDGAQSVQAESLALSDSARALHAAEQSHAAQPAVDAARVERVRQALAAGTYKVDAGRIADRLLTAEHQLAGKPGKA